MNLDNTKSEVICGVKIILERNVGSVIVGVFNDNSKCLKT